MIAAHQQEGERSGVNISCEKPCVVLTGTYWKGILEQIHDSLVFIDEGEAFVLSDDFARAVQASDNYYIIVTRSSLFNLAYSTKEVYGIRNTSGNRYQGTKRIYSEFYPLCESEPNVIPRPDVVLVEDSNSGYEFFASVCERHGVRCISAHGNGNVYAVLQTLEAETVLVIVDGAAFGQQMERVLSLKKIKNIILYLPESFEWIILKSGLIEDVSTILDSPADHIESSQYYTWERFFTDLLIDKTKETYLRYNKRNLNTNFLHANETERILRVIPEIQWDM